MRIGIDARLYKETGIGRYIRNLIRELSLLDNRNQYFVFLKKTEYDKFQIPNRNWTKAQINIDWHSLKEQYFVPQILSKYKLDVMHFPYFNVPILYSGKYLLTIHDLIVDHFNTGRASTHQPIIYKIKRLAYISAMKIGIKKASYISVISETTKKEVMDHYQIANDKIIVTYDSLDDNFKKTALKAIAKNYYRFPYILYVGNAYPHKNLENLIIAFLNLSKKKNIHLVLAGDDPFFYQRLKDFCRDKDKKKKIHFFGNANDEQLVSLYKNAELLVFPSFMEGFGLPNFESLFCQKLPVVSDIPVFRELFGNSLPYFDPTDVKSIEKTIIGVLNLSKLSYIQKVEKAKSNLSKYSWRKTAEKTLSLYDLIYKS